MKNMCERERERDYRQRWYYFIAEVYNKERGLLSNTTPPPHTHIYLYAYVVFSSARNRNRNSSNATVSDFNY